jgi:hypothetical protein
MSSSPRRIHRHVFRPRPAAPRHQVSAPQLVPDPAAVDQTFRLDPGDVLLLYTDGLIEARSASHEEFGIERVEAILLASARSPVDVIREQLVLDTGAARTT